MSKPCFKCNIEKPLSEFYAHPQMADGRVNKCKSCAKEDATRRRRSKGAKDRQLAKLRTSKTCFRCNVKKPLSEFYAHPQMADGHLNKCEDCTKKDVRQHRQGNPSVQAYDRRRGKTPKVLKRLTENTKRWRENNPEGYKAQVALNNAVRSGKVFKPNGCERCGVPVPSRSLHGHHDDYSKPLEVDWLCPRCHADHLRLKETA